MSDGRLLFDAVLDAPGEDGARSAFADWLIDNGNRYGQWYGEFVSAQLRGQPWEGDIEPNVLLGSAANELRAFALSVHHSPRMLSHAPFYWFGPILPSDNIANISESRLPVFDVNRGFIAHANMTCSDFIRLAPLLYSRHPITSVVLRDVEPVHIYADWVFYGRDHERESPYFVPKKLYEKIPRTETEPVNGVFAKVFPQRELAMQFLALGCMAYGMECGADRDLRRQAFDSLVCPDV